MFGGKAVLCKSEATLGSGWLRTDCARRAGNLLHGKLVASQKIDNGRNFKT